jgi:hypothetical protein
LLSTASTAWAQLIDLCSAKNACATSRAVTAGIDTTVVLNWRGEALVERPNRLLSEGGRFSANGASLGQNAAVLTEFLQGRADGGPVSFSLNESLRVPAEVSRQAAALGARTLQYTRAFSFDGVSLGASISIPLNRPAPGAAQSILQGSEAGASTLGLTRLSLRFDNGEQVALIPRNGELRAIATLNYDRGGLFDAVWEVATPASTSGEAVFRQIQTLRQYLGAGRQISLPSPALPSDSPGLYRLRLRILQPKSSADPVILSYQVSEQSLDNRRAMKNIDLVQPPNQAIVGSETLFQWQAQSGVRAYQLELYQQRSADNWPAQDKPLTGMQVTAGQTQTQLPQSVLNYLEPGVTYLWRVVAMDSDGQTIAASKLQELRVED